MIPFDLSNIAENDAPADKLWMQFYSYIDEFVRRIAHSSKIPNLDLEIDDLIRNILIKLWLSMREHHVVNPQSYIDMLRKHKSTLPLPEEEKKPKFCSAFHQFSGISHTFQEAQIVQAHLLSRDSLRFSETLSQEEAS